MPVFHRPRTVVVSDDGHDGLVAVAALIALAAVVSSAAAIITDVLTAILIVLGVAAVAGLGVLVLVLRRPGRTWHPPAPCRAPVPGRVVVSARVISAPPPRAIEAAQQDGSHLITGQAEHRSAPADVARPAPVSPRLTR